MRKSHETRRAEIIQATLDVAADEKSKKITTQVIADRLGISQPTIFRHFKNNEALFLTIFEWVSERIFAKFETILTNEEQLPKEKLEALITAQITFIKKHPGVARLLFSNQVYKGPKKLKAVVQKIMEMYIQKLSGLIQEGMSCGQFRPDIDPHVAARLIVSTVQGIIVRWSIHDFEFDILEETAPLLRLITDSLDNPTSSPRVN
ncbi:TetR/AcrR family transcriptional regulator [Luteithermobacter gelatinilyticus]|uniref:TetR/AcrR family transcriptional regulator n=1 Tax=Luteithermobacter gelatinilyticus TaxID=2582913 RepID=UPI001106BF95|nr:TetR/AcrR family transcriptional regulator [Luteithermobacter gelatinilyticus]